MSTDSAKTATAASALETEPTDDDAGAHFCDCGHLRYPTDDGWRCEGCDRVADRAPGAGIETTTDQRTGPSKSVTDGWEALFEHPLYDCPDCGSDAISVVIRQTRGADEPGTECFTCVACGHDWRTDGV